ncbi:MAG: hypothetical protein HY981_02750 [Candidatus Magasanikbacteria bacterium]|nr:hypothetical protein [Candidatus Magasanikbacteria bacterium]
METPKTGSREIIRNVYLYLVALITLIMMVVSSAQLINLALITWVFPEADSSYIYYGPKPVPAMGVKPADDKRTPEQIAADDERAQKQWEEEKQRSEEQRIAQKYRDLVQNISFLLVATPLFLYHWSVIRKDRKSAQEKSIV